MDKDDAYCPPEKQYLLLDLILEFHRCGEEVIKNGAEAEKLFTLPIREKIGRAKLCPISEYKEEYLLIKKEVSDQLGTLTEKTE